MSSLRTVPIQKKYGLQKKINNKINNNSLKSTFFSLEDNEKEDDEEDKKEGNKQFNSSSSHSSSSKFSSLPYNLISSSSMVGIGENNLTEEEKRIFDYDGSYEDFKQQEINQLQNNTTNLLGKNEPVILSFPFFFSYFVTFLSFSYSFSHLRFFTLLEIKIYFKVTSNSVNT